MIARSASARPTVITCSVAGAQGYSQGGGSTTLSSASASCASLSEFVHSSSVKATDFLLVCDGYFTFVTSGQSDFIRNFMTFRADVVFAAKAGSEGEPEAPLAKSRFRFLSSGALMARVHILKEILDMDFSSFATDADFYKVCWGFSFFE